MTTQADSRSTRLGTSLDLASRIKLVPAKAGDICETCQRRARAIIVTSERDIPICCGPDELRSRLGSRLIPCSNHDEQTALHLSEPASE